MADSYVTRLMRIRCNCGSMDNYLNVEEDHGILAGANQEPVMNANDHSQKNVIHFGNCKSEQNPDRMVRRTLVTAVTSCVFGIFGGMVTDALEDLGIMSIKCKPKTPLRWEFTNKKHNIEGAPALTTESKLTCVYGGVIEFVPLDEYPQPEESEEEEETEEEDKGADVAAETAEVFMEAMEKISQTGEEGAQKVEAAKADREQRAQEKQAQIALAAATSLPVSQNAHVCQDPEGYFQVDASGNEEVTYEKMFQSTPKQRGENYKHNNAQGWGGDYLNADGKIIDQNKMTDFHMNNFTVARSGCGAIAAYNTMQMVNPEKAAPFADVVYEMEPYGIFNNAAGLMPSGVVDYLNTHGCEAHYAIADEEIQEQAKEADAAIMLYMTTSNVHYVAFQANKKEDGTFAGDYTFYNELPKEHDVRTYEEFCEGLNKGRSEIGKLAIIVNKK